MSALIVGRWQSPICKYKFIIMTQINLDKIKNGIKDANLSNHVYHLIMTLISQEEKRIQKNEIKNPCECGLKEQSWCDDYCSH